MTLQALISKWREAAMSVPDSKISLGVLICADQLEKWLQNEYNTFESIVQMVDERIEREETRHDVT